MYWGLGLLEINFHTTVQNRLFFFFAEYFCRRKKLGKVIYVLSNNCPILKLLVNLHRRTHNLFTTGKAWIN